MAPAAVSVAGIATRNSAPDAKVVGLSLSFQRTTDDEMKLEPQTRRVNVPSPAVKEPGEKTV
jgi:hypothetical protein